MPDSNKLRIIAYANPDFSGRTGRYIARVNPDEYTCTYAISYDKTGAIGGKNAAVKFDRMPPATMKFKLLFDGTGTIDDSPTNLAAEIKAFQKIVYNYNGKIHSPYYLRIYWGVLAFGARLTEMSIKYSLFRKDGAALRAWADVTFVNYVDPKTLEQDPESESPDLTQQVRVQAGDTLPLLTQRVYGDTRHYLDVARINQLADFRHLQPGTLLTFPPLS